MTDVPVSRIVAAEPTEYSRLFRTLGITASQLSGLLAQLAEQLDCNPNISNSEKERRFSDLFRRAEPNSSHLRDLALRARSLSNVVLRNTIAGLLPADLKTLTSQKVSTAEPTAPASDAYVS